jgi:hypothetical protein
MLQHSAHSTADFRRNFISRHILSAGIRDSNKEE